MELWLKILIIAVSIYIALMVIFYFFQHFFFFRPEILPTNFQYKYPFPFEEVNFEMEYGGNINGIHFKMPNTKGVIFYLKGNSRSIKGWGKFARDFLGKGYDFFMYDYRGFGKSKGKRNENNLYSDAQHVYKWLAEQYPEKDIIVYGRSLGSGIAARVASWNKPKMLILDSPYYSFLDNVKGYANFLPFRFLLRYKLRTDQFIKIITCPVIIIHGTKDRLIKFKQSEMLRDLAPDNVLLLPIKDGGHNNLPDIPQYHDYLYQILNNDNFFEEQMEIQQKGE